MPKLKVSLSIGISNAYQEDVIEIDSEEWLQCETEEDKENLIDQHWKLWADNYIDGCAILIE